MYYFNSEKYLSKLLNLEIFDKGRNSIFKNNHSPRLIFFSDIWDKVFKSIQKFVEDGFQKIWSDITSNFLKAVFHKFYLVHSWIFCPIFNLLLIATSYVIDVWQGPKCASDNHRNVGDTLKIWLLVQI